MNRCNISFAISRVEDCLELNFKYIDYQTLAHLSYSSCVCLTSVRAARAQHFLSVRVLISDSIHGCLCSGSSGSVRYDSLSPGTYTLRIVARAANGEREIERRKIYIGRYGMEAP